MEGTSEEGLEHSKGAGGEAKAGRLSPSGSESRQREGRKPPSRPACFGKHMVDRE